MKPWLIVTITGTTAGAVVGALTYSAATQTSDLVATGTGLGINLLGWVGSYLASVLIGDTTGVAVRVASRVAGHLTEESMKSGGRSAAALMAATAGTLTTLSITVGSHIIYYTIEYGGKMTEELAKRVAEEYMRYKTRQLGYLEDSVKDDGWVIIDIEEDTAVDASNIADAITDAITDATPVVPSVPSVAIAPSVPLPNVLSPQ